MKFLYIACLFLLQIFVHSSAHLLKPVPQSQHGTATWVLSGKHWRAEANVPHQVVARAGSIPENLSPALGRYQVNNSGLVANSVSLDGPYRILVQYPGFALINPGISREYSVTELVLDGINAVWLYEPSLRSYRVYRPNGVYLPSEHRLQTLVPGWPLFVESSVPQASLSCANFAREFIVEGGASGMSSAPSLRIRPVLQAVLGEIWPQESSGILQAGSLTQIRFLLEASSGINSGFEFSLYALEAGLQTKIAGASLFGLLTREFLVDVPKTQATELVAVISNSRGQEIVRQSLTLLPGLTDGLNFQAELARILNPKHEDSANIRASLSNLDTGFYEAPSDFVQADLQHIVVSITGSDIASQSIEFAGATTSARLQVPFGNNRNIRVDYLDSTRSLIRSGQRTVNVTGAIPGLALEPMPTIFPDLISYPSSGYFAASLPVTLAASGAQILYTLDNTNPKSSSSVILVTGTASIEISESTTIRTFVRLPNGQESGVRYFTFIKETPPTPTITPSDPNSYSNQFFAGTLGLMVSGSGTPGEKIRLSDGSVFPLPHSVNFSESTTFVFQTVSPKGVRSPDYTYIFTQVELPVLSYEITTVSVEQFFAGTATIVLREANYSTHWMTRPQIF